MLPDSVLIDTTALVLEHERFGALAPGLIVGLVVGLLFLGLMLLQMNQVSARR